MWLRSPEQISQQLWAMYACTQLQLRASCVARELSWLTPGVFGVPPCAEIIAQLFFAQTCNLGEHLRDVEVAALLLGALIHDFKHPGRSNAFLTKTGHALALTYNDVSILENFHLSEVRGPRVGWMDECDGSLFFPFFACRRLFMFGRHTRRFSG